MKTIKFFIMFVGCLMFMAGCSGGSDHTMSAVDENTTSFDLPLKAEASEEVAETVSFSPEIADYIALVESYLDGDFYDMGPEETRELSDFLQGDYDIIGRSNGESESYYIAARKSQAPDYDNFHELDIGQTSGAGLEGTVLQIGYYDENAESTLLYELKDYSLLAVPFQSNPLSCFCLFKDNLENQPDTVMFQMAFSELGRRHLQFLKSHPQLSLTNDDKPGLGFYYFDKETSSYSSEPIFYFLPFTEAEQSEFQSLALQAEAIDGPLTGKETKEYLKKQSLYSTGIYVFLPDSVYRLFGNQEATGTLVQLPETDIHTPVSEGISVFYSEELWQKATDTLQNVMKIDYRDFDSNWFDKPLKSATLQFPELVEHDDGEFDWEFRCQTIVKQEKLESLSQLMGNALSAGESYAFSGCPYTAELLVTREDGQQRRIYVAADSCDSMAWEGRIPFEYGSQEELAKIFDEAMKSRLD